MAGNIPEAPGAPTGLVALAGNSQVTLNWTAPARTSGYQIDYYQVFKNGIWTGEQVNGLTKVIPGLTNEQPYTFTVRAHTSMGFSVDSNTASSTPSNPPNVPTGLKAVAGNGQVRLNWTAPAITGGSAVDYYIIYRNGVALPTHYAGSNTTIANLTNGVVYSFTIVAHNLGGYGDNSTTATATPLTVAGVPTGLITVPGSTNVSLAWTAPADNGGATVNYYLIYRTIDDVWTAVANVTGTSAVVSGLTSGHSYEFAVAAHTSFGISNMSGSVFVMPDIYITVGATASSQYVNDATAGAVTATISAMSTLPSITLSSANVSHYVNGVLASNEAIAVSGSSYSSVLPLTLAVGTNVLSYTFNDSAGNALTKSITVVYDDVGPTIHMISPLAGSYNNTGIVTLKWAATDATSGVAKTEISNGGTAWTTITATSAILSLNDGTHTLYVRVTDNAGNVNTTSVTLMVDTVRPTVVMSSPANNSRNNTGMVTVSWTATDAGSGMANNKVKVDNGSWGSIAGTSDTLSGLSDGSHSIYVMGVDKAGNVNTVSVSLTVDTTPPTVVLAPTGDYVPLNATLVVKFSEAMNESSTMVTIEGVAGTVAWNGNNATFRPSALAYNGEYRVTVIGHDLCGNYVTKTWTFNTTEVGDISGTLVDANGAVIGNAAVTLSCGLATTSDAYGHFVFRNVTIGSYNVTVVRDGFVTMTKGVSVGANATRDLGSMNMAASESGAAPSSDGTALIAIVLVALAAILIIVVVLYRRRKTKTP
jgi:titin